MRRQFSAAGLLLVGWMACSGVQRSSPAVHADEAKPAVKKELWKPEDFIFSESVGQYRISPDAKWLVWVKSAGDKDKDARFSNLYLSSLTEAREIALTRGTDQINQPRWSPDGEKIAFISTRARPKAKPDAAPMQIWLINAHGGEPWPLTELAHAPKQIEWLDKDTLVYSAEEDPALYEQEMKKKKDDSEVVDDAEHEPPVRLYKINVKDNKITRLTTNTDWIETFELSHDMKYAVASHSKSLHYTFDQKVRPVVILHDLGNGQERQVLADLRIRPVGFEWAFDNSGFYVATPFSTDARFMTAGITIVYFYDLASGKATQVNLDWENGLGFDLQTLPGGFVALLAAGSHDEPAFYSKEGAKWRRQPIAGEHVRNIETFNVSDDGKTIAYVSSTASKLPQLYRAQLDGGKIVSPVQVTKLNEGLVIGRAYSKTEIIHWKGANDQTVEGILYYPTNYEEGKKYPLITAIHGGPQGSDKDLWGESWAYPIQLLTQRGSFVLRPNYHGSNNYGLKWSESICCGKYYDLETPDINAGVDYLIGKGMVDADKIATMGWSNGSILSTSLITTYPERYKVASVGAGDIEWISDWGNVMFGESFDAYYFGKSPMQDPQLYINKSPFFKMDKVQAPVLIFHGTADTNVPPAQSWSYFRVLQYYGKVPVKFVVFPGEPHGPRKLTHQMRKVEEEVAWFDKYFFKTAKPDSEAVKEGSPLEALFRTKGVVKSGANYGTPFATKGKSVLVPEVVLRGDLEIGRFEVTRAQFAEFDKNYKVEPGTENYPANGITFDQAKAYTVWLSRTTGQTWRIPNEAEVSALHEKKDGENTLDYWVGYSLNPDDATRVQKKLAELPGATPLLKPVGSFAGQGKDNEELIFDLGGNVAEWAVAPDGKGKALGGSADQPIDPRASHEPNTAYVGVRVVRGAVKPAPESH
jgi:dipeptidyl aminopeptidase/acylaminoacyl peptidase/formylglycine-generating enzyme required for sulfatase activity